MPALTIKNVPDDLYESLKQSAKRHRRSINKEVIFCLERSFISSKASPEALLGRVHRLQARFTGPKLTDRVLRQAREDGRP